MALYQLAVRLWLPKVVPNGFRARVSPLRLHLALWAATIALPGCGASDIVPPTPQPPTFNLAEARTAFATDCVRHTVLTNQMCTQLRLASMFADGGTLIFPITLPLGDRELAAHCEHAARLHADPLSGADLGFAEVAILRFDRTVGASCEVPSG